MFYKAILRPILFRFDPETIHKLTFFFFRAFPFTGRIMGLSARRIMRSSIKPIELFGFTLRHPVGLAGGMDKEARVTRFMGNLGFSFIEIGTVTPKAQPGNSRPRLFRLVRNKALINRMGFNNSGADRISGNLASRPVNVIIGGNIGKNTQTSNEDAWQDYLYCFKRLYDHVDYFVVNVSCPNIKDLSELQNRQELTGILQKLLEYRSGREIRRPVLLKISPDLSWEQLDEVIEVVRATGIDGLVATNTSIGRYGLDYSPEEIDRIGNGGMSGRPLSERSTEIIRYLSTRLGKEFPIIASGGIMTAEDAMKKMEAGASLIQLYTGFVYEGPGLITRILRAYRQAGTS